MVTRNKKGQFVKGGTAINKGKKLPKIAGEKHHNWKGGKYVANGYVMILDHTHPCPSHPDGYIFEHRYVMEKHIDRIINPKEEAVHHINGDKTDNRIENLRLLSHSEHTLLHHKQGDYPQSRHKYVE